MQARGDEGRGRLGWKGNTALPEALGNLEKSETEHRGNSKVDTGGRSIQAKGARRDSRGRWTDGPEVSDKSGLRK